MKKMLIVLLTLVITLTLSSSVFSMGASPPKPYCETKYPVILVPGVIGFDKLIGVVDYWYGIPAELEEDGAVVYSAALSGWNSTEKRGEQLLAFIRAIKVEHPEYTKFNVIGHSHGATTARYAMNKMPESFASLTTIAGPHQGTPTADYMNDDLPNFLKPVAFGALDILLGDLIAVMSGHTEYVGENDAAACIEHFSLDGMERFNRDYPCAGVPKGSTRGTYGDDADSINGAFYGDGRGSITNSDDPESIRYYSWTGNIGERGVTSVDLLDTAIVLTNGMMRGYDYNGDADGFIPVSSSHFGEVLSDSYNWNHFDEINQALGIIAPFAANPVSVFRQHANRLQNAGL